MDCCSTEPATDEPATAETVATENSVQRCKSCAGPGRLVSRKTMLLMLKPEFLDQAMRRTYSFCPAPDCEVVYFEEQCGRSFTTDDLRVRVGVKAREDPIPLCYCFGFDETHVRDDISRTGNTTVPQRISSLIRAGFCACESRNPSGLCCLGEVNKAVERLTVSLSPNV